MMKALVRPAPSVRAYLGIGGTHYAPKFTPFMLGSEGRAVGHVLPKYHADAFDEQMLRQAAGKTVEKVEGVLIDWKGLTGAQRERILPMLEKAGLKWEKI
jgi:D-tyrosyl-tRNA(Tyr) deacylase